MRRREFSTWLQRAVTAPVVSDYINRCQRVEINLKINLDDEFARDKGRALLEKLTYTAEDQANNRSLKCNIYFRAGSDLKSGMSSLKTAVSRYFEFCNTVDVGITGEHVEEEQKTPAAKGVDSYQEFLNYFKIEKEALFEWGISSTIFPSIDKVAVEWENLKKRIFDGKTVYIRGYGRDAHGTQLYKNFYVRLLGNTCVEKDPTNNAIPHKLIQRITGLKRNDDIYNYQVSHIWGRTKNVFLFEAPWNICYVPKIIDPFTGHETKGIWPLEYQRLFVAKASELYKPFVDEYNQILKSLDFENQLYQYIESLKGQGTQKELAQFEKDVRSELSPIG